MPTSVCFHGSAHRRSRAASKRKKPLDTNTPRFYSLAPSLVINRSGSLRAAREVVSLHSPRGHRGSLEDQLMTRPVAVAGARPDIGSWHLWLLGGLGALVLVFAGCSHSGQHRAQAEDDAESQRYDV